jgi:hypothetical protein
MSAVFGPPPPIMAAAYFIRSGFCIICCTIGLFIISAILPIPGGIYGVVALGLGCIFDSSYYDACLVSEVAGLGIAPAPGT